MKNKTHLAVIVIIAALTVTAWAADQSVIEDIAEQTETGKTAPVEVPAEPQHLASKPDTFTAAELKAYENNILDRAEKFYTVSISNLFSIATILATLFGIFIAVLVVYLPYLKWRYEKKVENQIAEQSAGFKVEVQKAHDAIEKQGKEMQIQLNGITDDVRRHINVLEKHGKEMQMQFNNIFENMALSFTALHDIFDKEANYKFAFYTSNLALNLLARSRSFRGMPICLNGVRKALSRLLISKQKLTSHSMVLASETLRLLKEANAPSDIIEAAEDISAKIKPLVDKPADEPTEADPDD